MNVLTTKEIEFTCLQSNSNNTYVPSKISQTYTTNQTMYYLLFKKTNKMFIGRLIFKI